MVEAFVPGKGRKVARNPASPVRLLLPTTAPVDSQAAIRHKSHDQTSHEQADGLHDPRQTSYGSKA
jgi:hypothetical protein